MGHLTNIALNLAEMCSNSNLGPFLKEQQPDISELFDSFVASTLQDVKKTREILLVWVPIFFNLSKELNTFYLGWGTSQHFKWEQWRVRWNTFSPIQYVTSTGNFGYVYPQNKSEINPRINL